MAKKSTGRTTTKTRKTKGPRTSRTRSQTDLERENLDESYSAESRDYKEIISDLISNPAVKYVAGGIATALLTRLASNMSTRYPEISSFIKENLDSLEGRLGEFNNRDIREDSARH